MFVKKLAIFRLDGSLKLLNNLFKMFILPQVRLSANLWNKITTKQQERYCMFIRKFYRLFTGLPFNTPNELIQMLINPSSPVPLITKSPSFFNEVSNLRVTQIPKQFRKLTQMMCPKKCVTHNVCLISHHLPNHNISVNPYNLLIDYQ